MIQNNQGNDTTVSAERRPGAEHRSRQVKRSNIYLPKDTSRILKQNTQCWIVASLWWIGFIFSFEVFSINVTLDIFCSTSLCHIIVHTIYGFRTPCVRDNVHAVNLRTPMLETLSSFMVNHSRDGVYWWTVSHVCPAIVGRLSVLMYLIGMATKCFPWVKSTINPDIKNSILRHFSCVLKFFFYNY